MINIRKACPEDLDFLVETDLLGDGYTVAPDESSMTEEEQADHRIKISAFVCGLADSGWIAEDDRTGLKPA